MGKLEVRGIATRTVDYDRMKIKLDFQAKESAAAEASEKVMRECEGFLNVLKKHGIDISSISLEQDSVAHSSDYNGNGERIEYYRARRGLEIDVNFDMKVINTIRTITNNSNSQIDFHVDFALSNEDTIRQELFMEALKDAKMQAELMSAVIEQKVVGLISAELNAPKKDLVLSDEVLCMSLCCDEEEENYPNSDELSVSSTTYTESIYTTWEIA